MGQLRRRGSIWWVRYYRNGQRHEESARTDKKGVALDLLRVREGDIARGVPVSAKIGRLRFEDCASDLVNDFKANGKRSLAVVERRIAKHLAPFFGGRRMSTISTPDVRTYITHRQAQTEIVKKGYTLKLKNGTTRDVAAQRREAGAASNAEINRELATLKRIFALATQAGKLLHRPHIPMLREDNVRTGFFEPEQYDAVQGHLPAELQAVVEFAYVTGWRIDSEVLPLEWRQVDFKGGGEIRLDAGTTKNREGRVFPMTDDLRALLANRQAERVALQKAGLLVPWVFWRMVAEGRRGPKAPKQILSIGKAWKAACMAAGCPGRIPHDLRRTAIRNMVRRGLPERVAMKLTGHKTPSVFARYDIVSGGDLRTAAERLSGLTASTSSLERATRRA